MQEFNAQVTACVVLCMHVICRTCFLLIAISFHAVLPSPPRACTARATSSSSINIRWLAPSSPNGILNYTVTYSPHQSLTGIDYSSKQPVNISTAGDLKQLLLANLLKATSYSFILYATNAFGTSPPSVGVCMVYTEEDGEHFMVNSSSTSHTFFFPYSSRRPSNVSYS